MGRAGAGWVAAAGIALGLVGLRLAWPSSAASATIDTERGWLIERFQRLNAALLDSALSTPLSNDQGRIAWNLSFQMSALVEMLQATHDTLYASQFIRLADAVAAVRDDRQQRVDQIRHHVRKGWGASKYSMGVSTIWASHTGLITAPMAQFAAVVQRHPEELQRYADAARRLLQVARESMATHNGEYHAGPRPDEGRVLCFRESLPSNQQSAVGRAWLWIDLASPDQPYRERTLRLARHLRRGLLTLADSAYVWSYWIGLNDLPEDFEDVSHAGLSADFMVLCGEEDVEFTRTDIAALERTFLAHVVQPGERVAATVTGAGPARPPTSSIFLWGRLARHSPRVRDALWRLYRSPGFVSENPHAELLGLAHLIASVPTPSR